MKFNMGCGFNKEPEYVNIDMYPECSPDIQMDLETLPWDIESEQAEEVLFNHSLEHLGQKTDVFLGIIQELYRICKPNAKVTINAPHPRHDFYTGDPTHVRIITPMLLGLFSKKNCLEWQKSNNASTQLALYLNVDFEITHVNNILDPYYGGKLQTGELTADQLQNMARENNNIIQEYHIKMIAIK